MARHTLPIRTVSDLREWADDPATISTGYFATGYLEGCGQRIVSVEPSDDDSGYVIIRRSDISFFPVYYQVLHYVHEDGTPYYGLHNYVIQREYSRASSVRRAILAGNL